MDDKESTSMSVSEKKASIDLNKLGQAFIVYDGATDTLHVTLSDEEADEVVLLENGVIVQLKKGAVIGFSLPNVMRYG